EMRRNVHPPQPPAAAVIGKDGRIDVIQDTIRLPHVKCPVTAVRD
ncbi:hypothetical protein AVEN_95848-1, partial [Araneus ventricosus]